MGTENNDKPVPNSQEHELTVDELKDVAGGFFGNTDPSHAVVKNKPKAPAAGFTTPWEEDESRNR